MHNAANARLPHTAAKPSCPLVPVTTKPWKEFTAVVDDAAAVVAAATPFSGACKKQLRARVRMRCAIRTALLPLMQASGHTYGRTNGRTDERREPHGLYEL